MSKKSGTVLGIILGVIAFVGVVALLCYIFRDKLRMLIGCGDGCDCDCCDCDCDDDECGYFEVVDGCDGCCDESADAE